ncbi:MAG: HD domain-containing protein [Acidobacteria bacterium]|nr:HD domain-containing protein [Acidobacteriota bacterium]
MKSPYVAELQPNQVITATFLVQQKDIRQKKTGEPYLSLILGDRTGEIDAKMWDNVEEVMSTFERDDFVRVRGLAQIHLNRLQLTIQKLQKVDEASVDLSDYFPASKRDPEEMFRELRQMLDELKNPHLHALCKAILDDGEITRLYKIAPAAKSMHHAYLGGLLEHVLSMAHLARMTAPHYEADLDLMLTGVLLHDIGKIYELTYDRSFGYSVEGHLVGHMFIGLRMMDEKLRGIAEFPRNLRLLLEHMILSHHGQLEFGSPKQPAFLEALLLHHIDNLDSKMASLRTSLEKDRGIDGFFTGFNASLERQILKKDKFLNPPPAGAKETPKVEPQRAGNVKAAEGNGPRKAPQASPFAERLQQALRQDKTD